MSVLVATAARHAMELEPSKPDGLEKGIRLGCGAVFGALFGLAWVIRPPYFGWLVTTCVPVICAGVFAFLALRHGDAFWHRFRGWG